MAGLLEGKIALVVGASKGIGATSARLFAAEGAAVAVAARNVPELERVAGEITAAGGRAVPIQVDVTNEDSVRSMVERTVKELGRLDIAFNNAGAGHRPKPLADHSFEDFERIVAANLTGVFACLRHEIPAMVEQGGGAILNMASTAGLQGAPGMAPYVAAKHGVVGLTRVAALDYARWHVRVNALAPGPIETHDLPAGASEYIGKSVPLGRMGSMEEVARAAAWLCSDQALYVTGAVLPVDGGRLAGPHA